MTELIVKDKQVVVPGEQLAVGMDYLPGYNTYRLGDKVVAKRLGLVRISGRAVSLIPLSGVYRPKRDDKVIGRVSDITMSGWIVDIFSPYHAMLPMSDATTRFIRKGEDLTRYFDIGDYVKAVISRVTSQNLVDLSMKQPGLSKLRGGRVIRVNPSKVPRIIGKQGSMVTLIKDKTNCNIAVGQNGLVWVSGEPDNELRAVEAIKKVERESHLDGLTEAMEKFLGGSSTSQISSAKQDEKSLVESEQGEENV